MFAQTPWHHIFKAMEQDIFTTNFLRRNYQTTDSLEGIPYTTTCIKEFLEKNGRSLSIDTINEIMTNIGFVSHPIPNEADRIWLVAQEEKV